MRGSHSACLFGALFACSAGCNDWEKFSRNWPPAELAEPDCGSTGMTYYVAPTGADSAPGTMQSPFATLQAAADRVSPGDTVLVASGTYSASGDPAVYVRHSGADGACITFRSMTPGGAKLDGSNGGKTGWYIEGAFIRVDGFEVAGFGTAGIALVSHDAEVVRNHVHDINHVCSDAATAAAGVYVNAQGVLIEGNRIHDVGRLGPGENGCAPSTTAYQNADQGIDVGGAANVIIRNNLFYNQKAGWDIQVYSSGASGTSGLEIVNNTFAFANPNRDGKLLLAGPSVTTATIANNLFYRPTTAGIRLGDGAALTGIDVSHNLTDGAVTLAGTAIASVNASANLENADAKLMDPTNFDFHSQPGSPAIDAGMTLADVLHDLDGVSRPKGNAYDIGAYER